MQRTLQNNFKMTAVLVLVAVTFLVYSPVLKHELLKWDDGAHLSDNLSLRGLDRQHLSDIFTSYVNDVYIPLTTLSFAVEYHFFGLNPFVYHLNNLILHVLIVVLVFFIGQRLGLSDIAACLGALIFAIHPTHVESVAWVTERKDVLYSFFYLLAVYFYLEYTHSLPAASRKAKPSYGFLWATGLFGALSLLTKPMALSLPLILLLVDWFKDRGINRRTVVEKIPFFIVAVVIAWATYAVQARVPGESLVKGILVWFWTLAFYVRQFALPFVCAPIYRLTKPVSFSNPEYVLSIFLVLLLILIFIKYRKSKWIIFAFSYLFLSIFFLLRYDDKADINVVADRFIYLPSMGLCLWLGYTIEKFGIIHPKRALRSTVMVVTAAVLAWGGIKCYSQTKVWHDNIVLWTHELKYFPQEPIALNNLATALRDTVPYQKVESDFRQSRQEPSAAAIVLVTDPRFEKIRYIIGLYQKAVEADQIYADAVYNLGNLYRDIGLSDEAVQFYQKTITRDKSYKDAYFNLGGVYIAHNEPSKAIEYFDRLIALDPKREISYENVLVAYNKALKESRDPDKTVYQQAHARTLEVYQRLLGHEGRDAHTYFKMGYVYQDMKNYPQAVEAYKMSLELDRNNYEVLYNLGNTYEEAGQFQDALEAYTKVVALKPAFADVYLNMGIAYNQLGLYGQAEKALRKAAELPSKSADAYFNLGYIYEAQGKKEQAIEAYGKAVKVNPAQTEAYYNMGNTYAGMGELEKALESYKQALAIKPQHLDAMINASIISFKAGEYPQAVYYCDEAAKLGYTPDQEYLKALSPYRK